MTATTWSIGAWMFPRDLPKVTPETARNLMSTINTIHTIQAVFTAAFLGVSLLAIPIAYAMRREQEKNRNTVKQFQHLSFQQKTLEIQKLERSAWIQNICLLSLAACWFGSAVFMGAKLYSSWRSYNAVAFPELQRIANS